MTDKDRLVTAIGIILGTIEVILIFGMLYAGIIGLAKEVGKKIFGG